MPYNRIMKRLIFAFALFGLFVVFAPAWANSFAIGAASDGSKITDSAAAKRIEQVWRLPNGYEEYYMLLALNTGEKTWCERISGEAQIRKVDARPGVQVIGWRDLCNIEMAAKNNKIDYCRFVRGGVFDTLDGREFNQAYCEAYVGRMAENYRVELSANHWLLHDPYRPKMINAQAILKTLGFGEADLTRSHEQGLYQFTTRLSWEAFLLDEMLGQPKAGVTRDEKKFTKLKKRSTFLPDFSKRSVPADRFLRYGGTAVKMPANCYENPGSEFACRMLECLSWRDILSCRNISKTKEIQDLRGLFQGKCFEQNKDKNNRDATCAQMVSEPFQRIFGGAPEIFLPYLVR